MSNSRAPAAPPHAGAGPTRTPETESGYRRRAAWFVSHAAENLGIDRASPAEVAAYALSRREEWSKSTWRQTKAALIFHFEEVGSAEALAAVASLRDGVQSVCLKKTTRTSGRRAKTVSMGDLSRVIRLVRASKSDYSGMLESWLLLGACFGLRPHEWCFAEVVHLPPDELGDSEHAGAEGVLPYLRIRNSKVTNGRGNGELRHLNLAGVAPDIVQAAGDFARLMSGLHADGSYRKCYRGCAQLLQRANRSLHRKNQSKWVQLYSARHKFSADAKKNLTTTGVAATMGHVSDKTATEHYGRRSAGGALGPRPIAVEVARVRRRRSFAHGRATSSAGNQANPMPSAGQQK